MAGVLVRAEESGFVVADMNDAAREVAGVASDTFVGLTLEAIFPDVEAIPRLVREAARTGEVRSLSLEVPMRTRGVSVLTHYRVIPLGDDALVVFAHAPADELPPAPSLDSLQDSVASAWLAEGETAVYVWRIEPDGDFTFVQYNQRAIEVTDGGVFKIKGLRAQSLYWDQQHFLRFLTQTRDTGRAQADALPLRPVTGAKQLRIFRTLGIRRGGHLFVFAVDRTAEHTMADDLAVAEKRLRRAERLDSLGRLAGGIAHDFNNILAAIIGLGELIADQVGPETASDVRTLLDTAERGAAMTERLLAFARREEVTPVSFRIDELLEGLQTLLGRILGSRIDLTITIEQNLPSVFLDPSQLEQILVNLIVNAHEAMPEGGTLALRVRVATDGDRASFDSDPSPGEPMLLLEVEDDGVGIAANHLELIFEPFVSSKNEGSGGGLGLATVKSLVVHAGGRVRVRSEVGLGTTFFLLLPTSTEPPTVIRPSTAPPERNELGGRVLLVEDDRLLCRVMSRTLGHYGFEVVAAADGTEAMELMSDGRTIDILVTDVAMPHISGVELARELRKRFPTLPVLLCSGHHAESVAGELEPPFESLGKPVSQAVLIATIRRLLNG
ncbi:MAG: response regulator [Deltaproteobacteria bacterium]|nr:response regulator [Deltaproteobacteria bacterium]